MGREFEGEKTRIGRGGEIAVASLDILAIWVKMKSEVPDQTPGRSLAETIQGVLKKRGVFDFMTVARAMVLRAHLVGQGGAGLVARHLGIRRQTRHYWLKPESIAKWQKQCAERLASIGNRGAPPEKIRRILAESDWIWIADVLATSGAGTWEKKRVAVARAACRENSGKAHLRGIHRVTLFRNRGRLTALGEKLRRQRTAAGETDGAGVDRLADSGER